MKEELSEFRSGEERSYDLRGPRRWIFSHLLRYPWLPALAFLFSVGNNVGYSGIQVLVGKAFDLLAKPGSGADGLAAVALLIAGASALQGLAGVGRNLSFELLAQRIERDARAELFSSLLGKSQTFHSRQRLGDLMARATNDVHFLNLMFSPGLAMIMDSALTMVVPLFVIASIEPRLLLVPAVFALLLCLTVWEYNRRLAPATDEQRERFGELNAALADALEGIETVKANLGEARETARFAKGAGRLRDLYIRVARIEGRYWPLLVFALCWGAAFFHALLLWRAGALSLGEVVGYMLLFNAFRFTTFISIFSFNLFQMGLSSAARVLETIVARTDLDENPRGFSKRIEGRVEFRGVSFSFCGPSGCEAAAAFAAGPGGGSAGGGSASPLVLKNLSFVVEPGQTVAIVGRTGSGKTSLARLVNRVFDADEGQVLVDGVDVREWNLESLRSQIASIEQDVFLFSRSIRDNIAFGRDGPGGDGAFPDAEIEAAAREAQAHDFVSGFEKGYATEVGERGVTLSGGQKQRIAIARAFLVDPRILILDDSTSAVDSRTEDEIQKAMRRASAGRTTFLITHRLSQIRWADRILLLKGGELAASGTHAELLEKSEDYRRLFART
ncbi:MAG TPA: ABC transporter ATP-binding protein [Spirochaetales bacterium]|nr:ABC transporter ATP-binding protein [Spirochaetales bacterium]